MVNDPKISRGVNLTSMNEVKVRYGPSPTGIPHIGNIRTALFNYLFAKNQGGKFFLRIEDTDQKRIIPGAIEKIEESLKLLNLNWDDDIIFQSKRLDLYNKYLDILKEKDLAYKEERAWRFKIKAEKKNITWQDIVHGNVSFPINVIEDFIIIKSDGFPTYHFASVVDDHEMQISHVMRGDEWISSTPKHILLYEALGWQYPQFAHLPPILGHDHKKLSKREGAKSVLEYVQEGYLPQAIVNFMALLGWAPSPSVALREGGKKEQEIFSLDELIREFSLERINKNSPIFDLEKFEWMNGKWIRKLYVDDKKRLTALVKEKISFPEKVIDQIIKKAYTRVKRVNDFKEYFYLVEQPKINRDLLMFHEDAIDVLQSAQNALAEADEINDKTIRPIYKELTEIYPKWSTTEIIQLVGRALSGQTHFLPLLDIANIIGNKIPERLKNAIRQAEKQ